MPASRHARSFVSGALALVALELSVPGCDRRGSADAVGRAVVGTAEATGAIGLGGSSRDAEAPRVTASPPLATVRVDGESLGIVVRAVTDASPRIVYLHGMCSRPKADLEAFETTARAYGGVLGLLGDQRCPNGAYSFTVDTALQERRIDAALRATVDGTWRPPEVLIGHSQGALLAERLAAARGYPYVVLIGSPREPSADNLRRARAVVMISGERDAAKPKMIAGRDACDSQGIPAHFIEMPGAAHGELPNADAVMAEAIGWMHAHARGAPSSGGGP